MPHHRVLVTGSAGVIGRAVCRELIGRGHFVRGLDLSASPHATESHVGSITDAPAVDAAMDSIDTLVHLAAEPKEADFLTRLLPANVVGVYHVMDAARRHQLRRVVLTSTMETIGLPDWSGPVNDQTPLSPRTHYAATKLFAEAMGRLYARNYGLSVVAARIGWAVRNPSEARRMVELNAQFCFLSHRDAGRFFACAVEADVSGFVLVYAASKPPRGEPGVDVTPAKELLGWEARDTFPAGLPFERF